MATTLNKSEIKAIVDGHLGDPFSLLGAHQLKTKTGPTLAVRAYLPGALELQVLDLTPEPAPAQRVDDSGLFEVLLPVGQPEKPYRLRAEFGSGPAVTFYDCYGFWPLLGEMDLYLFGQGNHYRIFDKLGAHLMEHQGVRGVLFAVWAPSAQRVSVLGDFNQWDGRRLQMRSRGESGVWEIFVPHLKPGELYKFEIRTAEGTLLIKSDPYGYQNEQRPKNASVVTVLDYQWSDRAWMERRAGRSFREEPLAVYEAHLGSWRRKGEHGERWLTYRQAAEELVPYVEQMGFNAIEFMPLAEHPFDGSWGYQVTGYYAATSRYGSPQDLMYLIDACHQAGLAVILDWVPAHFPRDAFGLEYFDGTHLYEHADPRQGAHQDWGTLIFNYGRNEVRNFLVANALFWMEKYHIDGMRVDAVASMLYLDYSREEGEWIPNRYGGRENLDAIEFMKNLNTKVYESFPGVMMIAEESTAWPGVTLPVHLGGLGFLFKWNMGWMHDMLSFMSTDPVFRRYNTDMLTFALLYAFSENFILPLSHDEVVHGKASLLSKMPGDDWRKFANLRLLLGYMYGEPGKKMLFMGGEIGQWSEWNHDASLEWHLLDHEPHQGLQRYVRDLNRLYRSQPALYQRDYEHEGFEWIDFRDVDATVVSFFRRGRNEDDVVIFVFNFTPVVRREYLIGVPRPGRYWELINSDAEIYGGSNVGMGGSALAEDRPIHGQPCALSLTLPPLGLLILKPE